MVVFILRGHFDMYFDPWYVQCDFTFFNYSFLVALIITCNLNYLIIANYLTFDFNKNIGNSFKLGWQLLYITQVHILLINQENLIKKISSYVEFVVISENHEKSYVSLFKHIDHINNIEKH